MNIKSKLLEAWEGNPPIYCFINQPLPSSPTVSLSGGGFGTDDVDKFIKEIEFTLDTKRGIHWDTQTFGYEHDVRHKWHLVGYEALDHQVYKKFIILYYEPVNEDQVIDDCFL